MLGREGVGGVALDVEVEGRHQGGTAELGRGSVGEVAVDAGVVVPAVDEAPARSHPQVGAWDMLPGGKRDFGLEQNLRARRRNPTNGVVTRN